MCEHFLQMNFQWFCFHINTDYTAEMLQSHTWNQSNRKRIIVYTPKTVSFDVIEYDWSSIYIQFNRKRWFDDNAFTGKRNVTNVIENRLKSACMHHQFY